MVYKTNYTHGLNMFNFVNGIQSKLYTCINNIQFCDGIQNKLYTWFNNVQFCDGIQNKPCQTKV